MYFCYLQISPVKVTMEYIQLLILGYLITVCSSARFGTQKHSNRNENNASFSASSNRPNQIYRSERSNVPRQISGNVGSNMPQRIVIGSKPGMKSFSFKSATKNGANFQPQMSHKNNIPSQPNEVNQQPRTKQKKPSHSNSMNQNQQPRPRQTKTSHSNSMNQNQKQGPRQTKQPQSNSMNQNQNPRPRQAELSHTKSVNQNQKQSPSKTEPSHSNRINQNQKPKPRKTVPSHSFSMNRNQQPKHMQTVPSHSYSINQRQQQHKMRQTNQQFQRTSSKPLPNRNIPMSRSNANQPQSPSNMNQPQPPPNFNQPRPPPYLNQQQPQPPLNVKQPYSKPNQPQPPPNVYQPQPPPNVNQRQPQPKPNVNQRQPPPNVNQPQPQQILNQQQPPPNVNQPQPQQNLNQRQPQHHQNLNQRQPQPQPNLNQRQPQPQQNLNQRQPPPNGNKPQPLQNLNQRQPPPNGNQPQTQQNLNRQPPLNGNQPQPLQNLNQRQPPPNGNQPLNQGSDFQYHTVVTSNNPNNAQKFVFSDQAFSQGNKNALHADIDKRNTITDTSVLGISRIDIQSSINHTGMVSYNGQTFFRSNSVHASTQAPSINSNIHRINPLSPIPSPNNREMKMSKMHNSKNISQNLVSTVNSFDNPNTISDATSINAHRKVVLEQLNKLFENMPIFSFRHNGRNDAPKGKDNQQKDIKNNYINLMNQNVNRLDKIQQPFNHKSFSSVDFTTPYNSETYVVNSKPFNTYGQQTKHDVVHTPIYQPIKHMVNLNGKELTQKTNLFTVSRKEPYNPKKGSYNSGIGRQMNVLSMLENTLLHSEGQKSKTDELKTKNQPSWFVLSPPIIRNNTDDTLQPKNQTNSEKQLKMNTTQSVPFKHFDTGNESSLLHVVVANVTEIQDVFFNNNTDAIKLRLQKSDTITLRDNLLKDVDKTNVLITGPMSNTIESSVNISKFENKMPPYLNNFKISGTGSESARINTTMLSSLNKSVATLSQQHNESNVGHLSILNDSSLVPYSAMNDTTKVTQRMNILSTEDKLTTNPTAQSVTTVTDSFRPLMTVFNTITTVTTETNSVTNAPSAYQNIGDAIPKFDISKAIISHGISNTVKVKSEEGKSSIIAGNKNKLSKTHIPSRWNSIIEQHNTAGEHAINNINSTILHLSVENMTNYEPKLKDHMNASRLETNHSKPNLLNSSILFTNETRTDNIANGMNTSQRLQVKMKDIDTTATKTKAIPANIANLYSNIMARIKSIYSNAKTLDAHASHGEWYPHDVSRSSNPVIIIPNEAMLTYLAPGFIKSFSTKDSK